MPTFHAARLGIIAKLLQKREIFLDNVLLPVFVVLVQTPYRAFLHDVTAAMLVFQNKEMAAMLVLQTNPLGIELYFYVNSFFCFIKLGLILVT